jgi:DNA mismatch repair protein MutS2
LVAGVGPSGDPASIVQRLRETSEGVAYLQQGTALDLHDLPDPEPSLAKLRIVDIALDPLEILNLLRLISIASGLRETFREEEARLPLICQMTAPLPNLRPLYQRMRGRISPAGEVEDFASPGLREVRYQLGRLRAQIQKSLESILKRADEAHALRDEFITIRNDRYVIPVRNDNRGAVAGVVHGMSSSGQTAFVEPLETIEQNNELVRLRELEQAEVAKVLFQMTDELRAERESLTQMATVIGEIDLLSARARLAIDQRAIEPRVNTNGRLLLRDARHPLLEANLRQAGASIVPISFDMDAERRVMVVSGPNAGGKTVVLKTVGLLVLMAQAGLHVPAVDADLPVFDQVLTDVGDQQSIAANLSTFTAHIANIREMSDRLAPPALVLLDEVGTGTDPEEGSALAVAMVDYFRQHGAHVVVTTHYSGLKVYATTTSGVINASVEFDERTLKPTYRLLTGLAGASSGIEIARRFGLPTEMTEAAARRVLTASAEASDYLRRLKEQYDAQQQGLAALEEERAAVAEKFARLELEFLERDRTREATFRESMKQQVADFAARAERFAATIEDAANERRTRREIERRTVELKAEAATLAREVRRALDQSANRPEGEGLGPVEPLAPVEPAEPAELLVEDRVRILSLGQEGVVEVAGPQEIVVRIGALRFREKRDNLRFIERPVPARRGRAGSTGKGPVVLPRGVSVSLADTSAIGSELNVIGRTVDEATAAVDKFLDAAWLDHHDRLRIVHGVGLGALKRAIAELLSHHPHVASFHPAESAEGGQGATIVELRK